ncbi:MAG TPA: hypothetical protein VN920_05385 [Pyrinomonadaceae bacterium]|nr:hypothetical protein [Pyrinomonadaceae bacterium]
MFGKDTILADLQLIKALPKYGEVDELELQVRVCKMLGVALSVGGLAGIGSLITLVLGLRGRRVIKQSEGRLGGIWLAWLCIVNGALGALSGPPMIALLVWRSLK